MLFGNLVDYAGLFPPASLSMQNAVEEYRAARKGPHRWLLGRFICPASRLEELAGQLVLTMQAGENPWPISAILDGDAAAAAVRAWSFDAEMDPAAQIALLEVPLPDHAADGRSVEEVVDAIEGPVTAAFTASPVATPFFEIKLVDGWERGVGNAVVALAEYQAAKHRPVGAKLRCGGPDSEAFPSSHQVVVFLTECAAHALPFKATAGLHHPIRTYDPALRIRRHGFVNLLAATAFTHAGWTPSQLAAVVEETDPEAFAVGAAALSWRGHSVRVRGLVKARERFAAYGSCSFSEPTADLAALGMITSPEAG